MKKGGFLKGKKLGAEGEPTADDIKAMHRALLGKEEKPKVIEEATPKAKAAKPMVETKPKEKKISKPKVVKAAKPKPVKKVRITVDMPEDLHEALKIYTFKKRTTIKDIFLAHVEKLVK